MIISELENIFDEVEYVKEDLETLRDHIETAISEDILYNYEDDKELLEQIITEINDHTHIFNTISNRLQDILDMR